MRIPCFIERKIVFKRDVSYASKKELVNVEGKNMGAKRFNEKQEQLIVKAVESGTSRRELAQLYGCKHTTISNVVKGKAKNQRVYEEWSEAAVATLREQLAIEPRHTTAQIAVVINEKHGTAFTRGAITGKTKRLGLSSTLNKGRPKKPGPRTANLNKMPFTRNKPRVVASPSIVVSKIDNADSLEVSLIDLEDGMCKWMTGDATYCGHSTGGRRVTYCAKHHNAGTEPARYPVGIWRSPNKSRATE